MLPKPKYKQSANSQQWYKQLKNGDDCQSADTLLADLLVERFVT